MTADVPAALAWRYGPVADTVGDVITAWRHPTLPQPSRAEVTALLDDYRAHLDATAPERRRAERIDRLQTKALLLIAEGIRQTRDAGRQIPPAWQKIAQWLDQLDADEEPAV